MVTRVNGNNHTLRSASSDHVDLLEFEFSLVVAWNAHSRWIVRCMAAAGCPDLTTIEVLVLNALCHCTRKKRLCDICFMLNYEDVHIVGYSLRKLIAADMVQVDKLGKEAFYTPTNRGQLFVGKYREVREQCLLKNINPILSDALDESMNLLRTISGLYDQAARAAGLNESPAS